MDISKIAARFDGCRTYGEYLSAKTLLRKLNTSQQLSLVDTMIAARRRVTEVA